MYQDSDLLSPSEVARFLKTSPNTVGRAASRGKVGMRLRSGRLVALRYGDLQRLRDCIHGQAGNPNWIKNKGRS